MSDSPALTIRSIASVGVEVPMNFALGTSRGRITKAPLLLIDVTTAEGITGRAYLWSYFPRAMVAIASILQEIEERTNGERVDPAVLWPKLAERFALIGVQGVVRMAMAGFDIACWDALSTAAGVPLVKFLGGEPRHVLAYNSCGLGLMPTDALADEAETLLANGFRAIKLRLGYPTLDEDLAAVHAVKKRIPESVALMVDYNQALGSDEALKRGRALDRESIAWLEEPMRHDDYAGAAMLKSELAVPIQIGENFSLPSGMQTALDANCCDLVMPDLERIGGITGWRAAAKLAATRGIKMSSHLYPETSAHLLAAVTPTAHYLEYVDWADKIVQEPLKIVDGHAVVPDRPGTGVVWDKAAVERYRV
ncbi:enolase C-terminal domain-like protein [Rhodoplanes sp. Z2-YC6860]|uniref:enolase C-terminal domain-like protein n=1 Tax=Rhodoplanes sp. Z2-YC6860 TaxID=674703 RepID=UPI00078B7F13|nr:enolase C-terminal domain-like protein [Rhodoplanes sp. Z2-YC6860]AMN38836.1 mandelate racemase/muconate lactonizing protein [Rhodoplanes sp. Z2-YC6860]